MEVGEEEDEGWVGNKRKNGVFRGEKASPKVVLPPVRYACRIV